MPLRAKIGDQASGTCTHSGSPFLWKGTVVSGSSNKLVNGTGAARIGDVVATDCPSCPSCQIQQGSSTVLTNGIGTSRLGAVVTGPSNAVGNIISSSPDVTAGG
jgi:uncharacterized Zn-binding protein involved in type VI secretion